jgi:hypothetical protein
MQQATDYPGPVAVVVTRLVVVTVCVIVCVIVTARLAVIVVRAAPAVHVIQHARENALPHINTYQGRAPAN